MTLLQTMEPPPRLKYLEWADEYRYLAKGAASKYGKFNSDVTPWLWGVYDMLDDPEIPVVVGMKSAQVAWTEMILNVICKHIHIEPIGIMVMFSKLGAAKKFYKRKFKLAVSATPVLRDLISFKISSGNTWDDISFDNGNGFLNLITSNSIADVKSTSAQLQVVEEPDDANQNVGGQGSSIKQLQERGKTFSNSKILFGGTPTIKGLSEVEAAYSVSDKRVFKVLCHECGERHELSFDYFHCLEYADGYDHSVYGKNNPETAYYTCPNCGSVWSDFEKNNNVYKTAKGENKGWFARDRFTGVGGVRFNELVSSFPGSKFSKLKKKQLEALHKKNQGDESDWITFVNSSMGMPYEYGGAMLDADVLRAEALEYEINTVPKGGLILTAGIDVQHDRLAVIIRAWGRNDESWLVYWEEIDGVTSQKDSPVWNKLDEVLFSARKHESGSDLFITKMGIDSSDGATSDAVYSYVKTRVKRGMMAIKGSSVDTAPIYKAPVKKTWKNKKRTKAEAYGVQVYSVGVSRAKDLIVGTSDKSGRIRLKGEGPGRMHVYAGVRQDYYDQVLSEIKAPKRSQRGKLVWQLKSGERNEALDCEVYALHASQTIGVHNISDAKWDAIEKRLLQPDLFTEAKKEEPEEKEYRFKPVRRKAIRRNSFVNRY